jgi:hypothetical protein
MSRRDARDAERMWQLEQGLRSPLDAIQAEIEREDRASLKSMRLYRCARCYGHGETVECRAPGAPLCPICGTIDGWKMSPVSPGGDND